MSRFFNGLRADTKREVKVHPLYSVDVAYQKTLDYKKYLRVIPKRVPFNLDTHPSRPNTFLSLTLILNLSTPHHYQGLLLEPLSLAWLRLQYLVRPVLALLHPKLSVTIVMPKIIELLIVHNVLQLLNVRMITCLRMLMNF